MHWVILGACALRAGETCFSTTFDSNPEDTNTAQMPQRQRGSQLHTSDSACPKRRVRKRSAMCRSCRSFSVLARIEATPPQRVIECIDWTPICRSRNTFTNHSSVHPWPAFTPGSSFTTSVHLQLSPRNTCQPPIPHIAMSPVVTQSNSSGTFLSGDGHFRPAFDLDRHTGV
jgi:hypothetical protein